MQGRRGKGRVTIFVVREGCVVRADIWIHGIGLRFVVFVMQCKVVAAGPLQDLFKRMLDLVYETPLRNVDVACKEGPTSPGVALLALPLLLDAAGDPILEARARGRGRDL